MKFRALHKAFVWGAAGASAAAITGMAASLESLVPRDSVWAFLARIAALALVGPLAIAGFLALCERMDRSLGVSDEEEPCDGNDTDTIAPARRLPPKGGRRIWHRSDKRLKPVTAGNAPLVLPPLRAQAQRTSPRHVRTPTRGGQ
jgi:hypothetical protein